MSERGEGLRWTRFKRSFGKFTTFLYVLAAAAATGSGAILPTVTTTAGVVWVALGLVGAAVLAATALAIDIAIEREEYRRGE